MLNLFYIKEEALKKQKRLQFFSLFFFFFSLRIEFPGRLTWSRRLSLLFVNLFWTCKSWVVSLEWCFDSCERVTTNKKVKTREEKKKELKRTHVTCTPGTRKQKKKKKTVRERETTKRQWVTCLNRFRRMCSLLPTASVVQQTNALYGEKCACIYVWVRTNKQQRGLRLAPLKSGPKSGASVVTAGQAFCSTFFFYVRCSLVLFFCRVSFCFCLSFSVAS